MLGKTHGSWLLVAGLSLIWSDGATLAQRLHVVPEGPLSPQGQLEKFHLPPGFEIELVASEPAIRN